jgi:Oxysterol-binding protein
MPNDEVNLSASLQDYLLPSDSQLRPDMGPLKAKDFDEAERQKYAMEESQRRDKKMR